VYNIVEYEVFSLRRYETWVAGVAAAASESRSEMTDSFTVVKAGLETSIQDYPGRIGYWALGIPPSGPMDSLAFRLANLLVGNAVGAAALEYSSSAPRFGSSATV